MAAMGGAGIAPEAGRDPGVRASWATTWKARYLSAHHRKVRRRAEHPVTHARRMLHRVGAEVGPDAILLDLGAGEELLPELREAWARRRIGLDLRPGPAVDVVGDGTALPLRPESVDAVLLSQVLEHVPMPGDLLRECARVLKPKGWLALSTPQYWHTHPHPADYYRFTRQGLAFLCDRAGLRIVECRSIGGPLLVLFHVIELNLPGKARIAFVALAHGLFERMDRFLFDHGNHPGTTDSLGWAVLAQKG